jgi:hypothetical protein
MINDFDARTYNPSFGVMVPVRYLQREAAYSLKAGIFASLLSQNNPRVGQSTSFWMAYHLDHTLGHVDQICLSQNATYFEYFMTGLEADALIDYYTLISHDPRIPSAIKCLADYIFTNGWNAIPLDPNTFPYDVYRFHVGAAAAPSDSMTPLNQLISPMYAWLFMMTGNSTYQTEGDAIWDQGVTYAGEEASNGYNSAACCEGIGAPPQSGGNAGKVFSQNYMWGTSYVTWRSPPGTVKSNQLNRPAPPSGLSAIVH